MRIEGVPTLRDPRMLVIVFFIGIVSYALTAAGFGRSWEHLVLSLVVAVVTDMTLNWYFEDKVLFPMSALVTGSGVFLLVDSPLIAATGFAAFLGILSKHAIRIKGHHIFNPNNFGVVMACFAFPDWMVAGPHRWAGNIYAAIALACLGVVIVVHAKRWVASFSYAFGFFAFNFLRTLIFNKPYWAFSTSLLGPAMQLFIFFMISDPRTTPTDRKRQVVYGLAAAGLDNYFRHLQFRDAPLLSLFIVCGVYNLFRAWKPDLRQFDVWQMRAVELRRQEQGRGLNE